MVPESLNQNAAAQLSGYAQPQPLRKLEDLLQDIAALTGLPLEQLQAQVNDLEFPTYEFEGTVLVSPTVTDPLIDRWSEQIKTKLRSSEPPAAPPKRGRKKAAAAEPVLAPEEPTLPAAETSVSVSNAQAGNIETIDAEIIDVQTGDESPESTVAPDQELKLPKGFSQVVSNRYGPTLEKLLPQDVKERQAYLEEIIAETESGKDFLTRIATAVQRKYKGRTGRGTAYQGLLDKTKAIWRGMVAANEIVEDEDQPEV